MTNQDLNKYIYGGQAHANKRSYSMEGLPFGGSSRMRF